MTASVALETRHLVVRELGDGDAAAVQDYAGGAGVVRHLDWGPNTLEDTLRFLSLARASRNAVPRTAYHLAIVLKAADRLIGGCRLDIHSAAGRSADLGYVLHPRHWGHGHATEATRALVDFGFGRLALHRIWATCDVDNHASARVLEKVGMRREGHLRQSVRRRGAWRDTYLYAILEADWRSGPAGGPGDGAGSEP